MQRPESPKCPWRLFVDHHGHSSNVEGNVYNGTIHSILFQGRFNHVSTNKQNRLTVFFITTDAWLLTTQHRETRYLQLWHDTKFNADQINDENGACHK